MVQNNEAYRQIVSRLPSSVGVVRCVDVDTRQTLGFSINILLQVMQVSGYEIVGSVSQYFNPFTNQLMATITYRYNPSKQ